MVPNPDEAETQVPVHEDKPVDVGKVACLHLHGHLKYILIPSKLSSPGEDGVGFYVPPEQVNPEEFFEYFEEMEEEESATEDAEVLPSFFKIFSSQPKSPRYIIYDILPDRWMILKILVGFPKSPFIPQSKS